MREYESALMCVARLRWWIYVARKSIRDGQARDYVRERWRSYRAARQGEEFR